MTPQIFLTRAIDPECIEQLRRLGDVDLWENDELIPRTELLKRIKGKDAILTLLTDVVDAEFFDAAGPQLKIVANYSVGFDNVDVAQAAQRGVTVTNTPSMVAQYIAEHALGLMLAASRRIVEGDRFVRRGEYEGWAPLAFLGQTLWGRTLGIVGCGQIGRWTAELAHRAFEMPVLYYDVVRAEELEAKIGATFHELDVLLRHSDVVSLHVPLLPSTQHLIGRPELARMKPTAVLVNTSRGAVVDEAALYEALKNGIICSAGIDVFENEPKLHPGLERLPNVVVTPHIASAIPEARRAMGRMAAENIAAVLAGKPPLNPVPDQPPA